MISMANIRPSRQQQKQKQRHQPQQDIQREERTRFGKQNHYRRSMAAQLLSLSSSLWIALKKVWFRSQHGKGWSLSSSVILLGTILLLPFIAYKCIDACFRWMRLPKYANRAERDFRSERFPSVEDRVRIYMSNWYLPSCQSNSQTNDDYDDDDAFVVRYVKRKWNTTTSTSKGWWFVAATQWILSPLYDQQQQPQPKYYYEISEIASSSAISSNTEPRTRTFAITNQVQIGRVFYMDKPTLYHCSKQRGWSIRFYCSDSMESLLKVSKADSGGWQDKEDDIPILVQFSDESESLALNVVDWSTYEPNPRIPHIKKIRWALSREEIDRLTTPNDIPGKCLRGIRHPPTNMTQLQPILWLLNVNRHFKYSMDVPRYDIPWEDKKDAAVFRGLLTGLEYNPDSSDEENCQNLIRCKLAYQYAHSKLVDAKVTSVFNKLDSDVFHGINITGESLRKEEMLQYKGFIMLEGNDVASGLMWR
jgi:hypothetical protein